MVFGVGDGASPFEAGAAAAGLLPDRRLAGPLTYPPAGMRTRRLLATAAGAGLAISHTRYRAAPRKPARLHLSRLGPDEADAAHQLPVHGAAAIWSTLTRLQATCCHIAISKRVARDNRQGPARRKSSCIKGDGSA